MIFGELGIEPELVNRLYQQIQTVLPGYPKGISLEKVENMITIGYRVRTYQVHQLYKTGKISKELSKEAGPDHDGFLVKVIFYGKDYVGAWAGTANDWRVSGVGTSG